MHGCQAVLINKMLPEEDRVLIKVLEVEKGYGTKRITNKFTRSGALCKSESTAAGSVTSTILKERLIEERRHFDHYIIDRAVNQVSQ